MSLRAATLLVVLAACSRTPPEPAPSTTASTAVATSRPDSDHAPAPASASASAPPRCIAPTPSTAPVLPKPAPPAACPPDPEPNAKLPTATASLPDAAGTPHLEVELAMTPHDVEKGLMFRRSMPEDHGMLFRLEGHRDHTFWMHNTCIPLDMLFVDDDGTIVGIVEGAPPLDDGTRSVGCPSTYVLEVNAGWCRRHGVKAGQRLGLPAAIR